MKYGMPTLVECRDLEHCASIAKELGIDFIEINMSFPQYQPHMLSIEEAKRIAEKYVRATNLLFEKTGQLWEKYNAETGEIDTRSEYGTPAMLGWSAGVYAEFFCYLKRQEN